MYSMTGYACVNGQFGSRQISLELRSVNHRYLDVQFRLPEELRRLENQLREMLGSALNRGKVECRVQLHTTNAAGALHINHALVEQLAEVNEVLRKQYKGLSKLSVADVLHFPGVVSMQSEDDDVVAEGVLSLMQQALSELNEARGREGEKLKAHLLKRLDDMGDIVQAVMQLFPQLLQQYMDKAEVRLREAVAHIDNDRLQQEFALFMQKADIDEELNRLQTHLAEVRRLVTEHKGSVGKRLDFLMQELNREANTLGSKSISADCTQASVGLKVLIEQMREQVQNIE